MSALRAARRLSVVVAVMAPWGPIPLAHSSQPADPNSLLGGPMGSGTPLPNSGGGELAPSVEEPAPLYAVVTCLPWPLPWRGSYVCKRMTMRTVTDSGFGPEVLDPTTYNNLDDCKAVRDTLNLQMKPLYGGHAYAV
jgi:hypothetical protein